MTEKFDLTLTVNGRDYDVRVEARKTLVDTIREVLLPTGLVDIKVAAVDEIWSGLKLMIRKELR